MTAAEAAIEWCRREHGGDWRKAWMALKPRDGVPVAIHPSIPRDARRHWVMLGMGREGILVGDCGLYTETVPYSAVTAATGPRR